MVLNFLKQFQFANIFVRKHFIREMRKSTLAERFWGFKPCPVSFSPFLLPGDADVELSVPPAPRQQWTKPANVSQL